MSRLWIAGVGLVALTGCKMDMGMMSGDLGVTAGGVQDIGLAREIIANGGIPSRDQFSAEGLFSEHSLPLDGEACEETLCARTGAVSVAPVGRTDEEVLVQLGFATALTAETWEREAMDLAVVVDVSCSMSGEKIESTRDALHVLADNLRDDDRVTLVAFDDSSRVVFGLTDMDDAGRARFHDRIEDLREDGGTDIEAGLRDGYAELTDEARPKRVLLLTDAQPNVGATRDGEFLALVDAHPDVGVSVFGVGLDLGAELAKAMSETRGGNSYFLSDGDAIRKVFSDELDFVLSPIAYDLKVNVTPVPGYEIARAYGAPMDDAGAAVDMGAATLFLSARDGGMGVTFRSTGEAAFGPEIAFARMSLSYESLDGTLESEVVDVHLADEEPAVGPFVMAALVDEFQALEAAADACRTVGSRRGVLATVEAAHGRLAAASAQLGGDEALDEEAALMRSLEGNLRAGATCGN